MYISIEYACNAGTSRIIRIRMRWRGVSSTGKSLNVNTA
ncbi:Uncharacterised protein [Mycobacteroides abscessus subsp. abscessus]|nr:Uncharacterised protein [Mycobacteroides abscessus subsp. abscessus]SKW06956.1 Uncharacterised protein [Mycobacteroides abscessus subsp. abscessus]